MRLLDASTFALLVDEDASPPNDPATGLPVVDARKRLEHLVREVSKASETLIIPTPGLAEVLVRLEDRAPDVLNLLDRSARFKIGEFDVRAAVEVAAMTREALRAGDKRGGSAEPWQKVKYDRQIIAIARVYGANLIYSDDDGIKTFADQIGLTVVRTWELPLPPADKQIQLFGDEPGD